MGERLRAQALVAKLVLKYRGQFGQGRVNPVPMIARDAGLDTQGV
jgi:hypothetical protein